MNRKQKTEEVLSIPWLHAKGWTVRQAAKAIDRSWSHVASVLKGKRKSTVVTAGLRALPKKKLRRRTYFDYSDAPNGSRPVEKETEMGTISGIESDFYSIGDMKPTRYLVYTLKPSNSPHNKQ